MHRSLPGFRQRVCAAALVALFSARAELRAAAQDGAPPVQAAPAEPSTTSAPLPEPAPATVSSPVTPPPAPTAPAAPSPADQARLQELARLYAQLERQRAKPRGWRVPTVGLALGIASLAAGGILIADSLSYPDDAPCEKSDHCATNDRRGYAGASLLLIGFSMTVTSIPMLIVRSRRESRIKDTEDAIRRLGGQVSLAPTFSPRGDLGLRLHARF